MDAHNRGLPTTMTNQVQMDAHNIGLLSSMATQVPMNRPTPMMTHTPMGASETVGLQPSMMRSSTNSISEARDDSAGKMTAILEGLVNLSRNSQLPHGKLEVFDRTDMLKFPSFLKGFQTMVEDITTDSAKDWN